MNPVIVFRDDQDLVDKISGFKGYSQGVIGMSTLQKPIKKNRLIPKGDDVQLFTDIFDGDIFCTSDRFVSIGFEYEKSVNNRLDKEGKEKDFEAQGLPWGEWLPGSKIIITHTDKSGNFNYYLRLTYLNANDKASKALFHYEDGTHVKTELIDTLKNGFLPVKSKSKTQNTDNEVKVNAIKVAGIITLKFAGKTYVRKGYVTDEQKQQLTAWLLEVPLNDLEALKVA